MRIFGRKANQQSATPTAPEVPPELQPYYGRPSLNARLRRVSLFILPVVAALALIAALIAGGMWLKNRADANNHKVATSQSTARQPATEGKSSGTSQSGNSTQNQSGGAQSTGNSSGSSGAADSSSSTSGATGQQSANSSTSSQMSPSNIPSTGPDPGMYLVALAMAVAGTAAAYARQLKTVRR